MGHDTYYIPVIYQGFEKSTQKDSKIRVGATRRVAPTKTLPLEPFGNVNYFV